MAETQSSNGEEKNGVNKHSPDKRGGNENPHSHYSGDDQEKNMNGEKKELQERGSQEDKDVQSIDDILNEFAREGFNEEIMIESEDEIIDKDARIEKLESELEEKQKQIADYYSRYLRLKAEFDNYKKRARKEKSDVIKYSNETLILEMLPILDNLERAIDAAKQTRDFEALVNGLEMIHKQKKDLLEKFGITAITALGEIFDPRLHEAFMREDVEEDQDKRVLSEVQKGYLFHEKVLRPARVSVGFSSKKYEERELERERNVEQKQEPDGSEHTKNPDTQTNDLNNSEGT